MNRFSKKLYLSCAFLTFGLLSAFHAQDVQAATNEVKVQINDNLVYFPEAQPFIDKSSSLQIPLRSITEQLGYKVDWMKEKDTIKVTLSSSKQTIVLKTGDSTAMVNDKPVQLESPVQFLQGSVYLPLRFVSETIGHRIQWDTLNRLAIIDADGMYHAPAFYRAALAAPAPAAPASKPPVIQNAFSFMGVPYSWGGTSPSGFDCSGFVSYVYRLSGVQLPRTSVEMYDKAGVEVSNLQEGDLVFFSDGRKTNHVGIYLGNQQFISATNSGGVSVASLTTGYWGKKYVGAKRVLS